MRLTGKSLRSTLDFEKHSDTIYQPVDSITTVTGSLSGTNFVEKTVDQYGRVSGNYELIKDTGVYGGSPWGFDTFHWVSNKILQFLKTKTVHITKPE